MRRPSSGRQTLSRAALSLDPETVAAYVAEDAPQSADGPVPKVVDRLHRPPQRLGNFRQHLPAQGVTRLRPMQPYCQNGAVKLGFDVFKLAHFRFGRWCQLFVWHGTVKSQYTRNR